MIKCAMCGMPLVDAFCNFPTIIFCCTDCKVRWMSNAIAEDVRILMLDGGLVTYGARVVEFKDFFRFKYFEVKL